MATMRQTLEQLNHRQENNEQSCVLDWLSTVDYTLQQSDLLGRRQEGTGKWLLTSKEYKDWLRTRHATLLCPGIPGAGKTICSAIIVDDLFTRFEDRPDVGIAYIYCNFNRRDEQHAQDLLSSLLRQLSQQKAAVPDAVKDLYKRYHNTPTRPRFDEISKALQLVISLYSDVFIVFDALDECEYTCRTRLLREIMRVRAGAGANVFATSRPTEIHDLFKDGDVLEIRAHEDDVRRYLDGNMFRLPGFVSRNRTLQEEIMVVISRHVQGMFLLAQLHLESLIGRRSAKSTRAALKELSKGFDDHTYDKAYGNAISRVQGQLGEQTDLAMQTLSWLVCARRPLTSLELQYALAIEEGESSIDEENKPEVEDILAVCAGLVTVENESGIIRLVHYTTQEYLERKKEFLFPNAQDTISILCVTYISFEIFGSGICESDEAFEERLESHPFYLYAARHWSDHVRTANSLHPDVIDFLKDQPKVAASEQAIHVTTPSLSKKGWSQDFPREKTGLHLAAYRGIEEAVLYFLQNHHPVDISHNGGWTPLKYAISGGRSDVVRLLLSHGADPNGASQDPDIPLALAAQYGKDAIVRLLLEWGADVDAPDRWYGSALIAACDEGQLKTAEILVNSKADINTESELYGSPLEAAASAGHWRLVEFLLEKGAEPNSQGTGVDTALQSAAFQGQEDIVHTLLSHHADVNRQAGASGNALIAASMNGAQRIVQMLLDSGADINAEHELGTALVAAVAKGQSQIAQMLLNNGADVNGRGRLHGTALHAATALGNIQIVQMLLDRGADHTIRAGVYKTPLRAAMTRGHREVVSLLRIQKGSN
ncbi:uncharacterized protein N7500_007617 [Penicillium coprophilum]|uniref:uncharacterized protein n=1 Tax=Penicillium coprophilum TaxID=36646 RepID=UPI00239EE22B|nr:uncharacterized protein N7500_007617 [Penicillium coprophilum]KAJ5157966.1 hypothetical protein N7500_007617 [Penicillium coprophilum]